MQKEHVSSSILKSIGYEPTLKILEIEYHDGMRYQYLDVPKRIFKKLMAAESHGRFYLKHIRNKYKRVKIR